jgi:hypothetical protein
LPKILFPVVMSSVSTWLIENPSTIYTQDARSNDCSVVGWKHRTICWLRCQVHLDSERITSIYAWYHTTGNRRGIHTRDLCRVVKDLTAEPLESSISTAIGTSILFWTYAMAVSNYQRTCFNVSRKIRLPRDLRGLWSWFSQ